MSNVSGVAADALKAIQTTAQKPGARLFYLDNLKVLLIILVVMHHAGQPYGPGGDWPIPQEQIPDIDLLLMSLFFIVNASFFMGLFFMISAYFMPGSYDRKGPAQFLKDRMVRLGVPTLIGVLGIIPVMVYALGSNGISFIDSYVNSLGTISLGWLWFLAMLLIFAAGYVAWRLAFKWPKLKATEFPGTVSILAFAGVIALVSFAIRLLSPVNEWTWLHLFEPAHITQYVMMFAAGIVAYRAGWLDKLPAGTGRRWLIVAGLLILAVPVIYFTLGGDGFDGGLSGMALLWSVWEALMCVSMSIGLLALFKNRFTRQGTILKAMSDNAFAVYLIHIPVVVFLQYLLVGIGIDPIIKFILVFSLGIPICFLVSHIIRSLPYAKAVL